MSNNRGNTVYNNNAAPFSKVPLYKEHPYGMLHINRRDNMSLTVSVTISVNISLTVTVTISVNISLTVTVTIS